MKGGSCSSCLPQTGGACPCQAKPFGGSRRTRRKRTRVSRSAKRRTQRQKQRK